MSKSKEKKQAKKDKQIDVNDYESKDITTAGKLFLIIFFIVLFGCAVVNRFTKVFEKTEKPVEKQQSVYKSDYEIISQMSKLYKNGNYKLNLVIDNDNERKEIIIKSTTDGKHIYIKTNQSTKRYIYTNNKYYLLEETPIEVNADEVLKEYIQEIIDLDNITNKINSQSIDLLEESYFIKRFKIIKDGKENIILNINYNNAIEKIIIDCTNYYNELYNANQNKVTYEMTFTDVNSTVIDELKLYKFD